MAVALAYAEALDCPRVHIMTGLILEGLFREDVQGTCINNLRWTAREATKAGLDMLMEPINTRDIPRLFLDRQDHAHQIVGLVGAVNLAVRR